MTSLDALLDRTGAALRHEQVLTAQLPHELRTPLAGMRAEVDWARDPGRCDALRRESSAELAVLCAEQRGSPPRNPSPI